MMADPTTTTATRDFHHPYTPYAIQLQFMNAVYDALEDGCVGIFESPTGTVSTLHVLTTGGGADMGVCIGKIAEPDLWCTDVVA